MSVNKINKVGMQTIIPQSGNKTVDLLMQVYRTICANQYLSDTEFFRKHAIKKLNIIDTGVLKSIFDDMDVNERALLAIHDTRLCLLHNLPRQATCELACAILNMSSLPVVKCFVDELQNQSEQFLIDNF